jgi:sugar phosphate isomerase/epimerase
MVAHVYVGFDEEYKPTAFGIENYGKVVEYASEKGVKIAFENTEGTEYLDAVLNAYKHLECVGFCWDSGHEMCYNYSENLLERHGDVLIATHINDNLGIRDYNGKIFWHDDLHLLPFDGTMDYRKVGATLRRCNYQGTITLEISRTRVGMPWYKDYTVEQYFATAAERAAHVARLCE